MSASVNQHPSRPDHPTPRAELPERAPPRLPEPPLRPSGAVPAKPRRGSRALRYILLIGGALGLVVLLGFVKFSQISMLIGAGEQMQKAGPPPEAVSTRRAEEQTWERVLNAVASVVSAKGVALANDAPGVVSAIHFDSGQSVKQGQILVELDSRVERAQLASTRARLDLSRTSLDRSNSLVTSGVIAQAQVDADSASFKGLTAELSALAAQIDRKIVRAPFSGRVGLRQVNLGQYLAPGSTVTVLESADADYVDFTLPQHNLGMLQNGMVVRATQEGAATSTVEGEISAIDPTIDPSTRAVKVRARFPPQSSPLRPGMFLRVSVLLPEQQKVVAIPMTALIHASYGDSVFVVEQKPGPDGKPRPTAQQKFVKLGEMRGDFVAVVEGLKAGEEVVTAGGFKLRNGLPLKVDNTTVKQDPKLAPEPENR
jgi:membrane fusion protein (multidrug efflux system)